MAFYTLSGKIETNHVFEIGDVVSLTGDVEIAQGTVVHFKEGSQLVGNKHNLAVSGSLDIEGSKSRIVEVYDTNIQGRSGGKVEIDYAHIDQGSLFTESHNEGSFSLKSSIVEDLQSGLVLWEKQASQAGENPVQGNIFHNVDIKAVMVRGEVFTQNTLVGDSTLSVYSSQSNPATLENNNFLSKVFPTVTFYATEGVQHTVSASGNYWGGGRFLDAHDRIHDHNDNTSLVASVDVSKRSYVLAEGAPVELAGYKVDNSSFTFSEPEPASPPPGTPTQPTTPPDTVPPSGTVPGILVKPGTMRYEGKLQDYEVDQTVAGFTITRDGIAGTELLEGMERLVFDDIWLALDIEGGAGQVYRLYKAALDREPDTGGLGFWIDRVDHGASMTEIASAFLQSNEFRQKYGAELSDDAYITELYNNVLDRAPDVEGKANWLNLLSTPDSSREQVLLGFSESVENQANVSGLIEDGIQYDLWIA
ncbi:MAG: DUF4214 domain-containing protein [Marinobacterium sp.]|nr:DUF4214 domain-containing protein [Marinobacterium sp.]